MCMTIQIGWTNEQTHVHEYRQTHSQRSKDTEVLTNGQTDNERNKYLCGYKYRETEIKTKYIRQMRKLT